MGPQIITIVIHSDIDPSQLLDITNKVSEHIVEFIDILDD